MLKTIFLTLLIAVPALAMARAAEDTNRVAFCNVTEYLGSSYNSKMKADSDLKKYAHAQTRVRWLSGTAQKLRLRSALVKGLDIRIQSGPSSFGSAKEWFDSFSVTAEVIDLKTKVRSLSDGIYHLDNQAEKVAPMGLKLDLTRSNRDRIQIHCVSTHR